MNTRAPPSAMRGRWADYSAQWVAKWVAKASLKALSSAVEILRSYAR